MDKAAPCAFELRWRAASARMRECITALTHALLEHEQQHAPRVRARKHVDAAKFAAAIEVIAGNLAAISIAAPGAELAVRRSAQSSQTSSIFGAHFRTVLDIAERLGLIEQHIGYRYTKVERRLSSIRALPAFRAYLPDSLGLDDLELATEHAMELRDKRGKPMPFSETPQTARWRREIERINASISGAAATLDGAQVWLEPTHDGAMRRIVTAQHATCHRMFRPDWNHGGRLYRTWWQNLPKLERLERIRINGEPVAEIDWSTLHPRLAYWHAGASWPFADGEDCYVAGDGERAGWKRMTNALLMASRPLNRWPGRSIGEIEKHRGYFPAGTKPREVFAAIRRKHAPIAAAFECGLALRLQRVESDMLVAVLLDLVGQGIPALPEHDSVIVAQSHAQAAVAAMQAAAHNKTGRALPVSVERAPPQEARGNLSDLACCPFLEGQLRE